MILKMRKLFLALGFLALSSLGFSQEKAHLSAAEIATRQTEKMATLLSLTADQQVEVFSVNLDAAREVERVYLDGTNAASVLSALHAAQVGRISSILTEDQRTRFAEINARYADRARARATAKSDEK